MFFCFLKKIVRVVFLFHAFISLEISSANAHISLSHLTSLLSRFKSLCIALIVLAKVRRFLRKSGIVKNYN